MNTISKEQVVRTVDRMCDIIVAREVAFCELDSVAGDGDFGMSLAKGFRQLKAGWSDLECDDIGGFLKSCGMVITEYCGGASGPIWGSAFRGMGRAAQEKAELSLNELAAMLRAAVDAIQKRGGAKPGEKTLLDAFIPLVESLESSAASGFSLAEAFARANTAAAEGAENTKKMVASKGRASYVGDRSLDHPDAGAMAIAIISQELMAARSA